MWHGRPLVGGRVADVEAGGSERVTREEEEAVALTRHVGPVIVDVVEVAEVTLDLAHDGGAREERRRKVIAVNEVVDGEDAGQGERQEVLAQQAVGVDDGTPRLADGAAGGEAARHQAPDDVREHVAR